MTDKRYARKLAFGKRIADLLADEDFAAKLARTEDGEFSVVIADWDDTLGHVFAHIDRVEAPATLLIERGDSAILGFTMDIATGESSGKREGFMYAPDKPLREFLHYVMEESPAVLSFPEPLVLPNKKVGQLAFDIGPVERARLVS